MQLTTDYEIPKKQPDTTRVAMLDEMTADEIKALIAFLEEEVRERERSRPSEASLPIREALGNGHHKRLPLPVRKKTSLKQLVQEKREDILKIVAQYGGYNARLFGPLAHGEDDEERVFHLVINLKPKRSLFDLGGIWYDMEELLGCEVDIVYEEGLRPQTRENILKEARPL